MAQASSHIVLFSDHNSRMTKLCLFCKFNPSVSSLRKPMRGIAYLHKSISFKPTEYQEMFSLGYWYLNQLAVFVISSHSSYFIYINHHIRRMHLHIWGLQLRLHSDLKPWSTRLGVICIWHNWLANSLVKKNWVRFIWRRNTSKEVSHMQIVTEI